VYLRPSRPLGTGTGIVRTGGALSGTDLGHASEDRNLVTAETRTAPAVAASAPAPEPSPARPFGHLNALDGLRAVAVLAVMAFHAGVSWLPGGFLGVDVFFVLSGFLITSLLLEELGTTGRISLGQFWARRARRLLPALLLVLAGTAAYAALFASPESLAGIRSDAAATLGYVANWHFIANQASYFARTGDPSPLAHTWSLAIEEQFYLVWPVVVLLVGRGRNALAKVGVAAAAGMTASVVAMVLVYDPSRDPSQAYYGTDTRSQVIMVGAALAVIVARWRRRPGGVRAVPPALAAGAGLVASAGVGFAMYRAVGTDSWVYRGGLLAVALGVAVVIGATVVSPGGGLARALSLAPLRYVGRISYGLYLWHWPLYLVINHAHTGLLGARLLGVRFAATFATAVASYHLVEMPLRRGALGQRTLTMVLPFSVAAVVAALLAGTALPVPVPIRTVAAAAVPVRTTSHHSTRPPLAPGQPVKLMVVGDSVAETLGQGLSTAARLDGFAMTNEGTLGCGVVRGGPYRYFGAIDQELPQCETWPSRWATEVKRDNPDVVLMIVGRWEVMDRVHAGQWTRIGDPAFDAYLQSELDLAVGILSAHGAQVALATAPYYLRGERPDGGRWPEDDPARVDTFNQLIRAVAARHPDTVTVVDLNGRTSVGNHYSAYVDGIYMRYDGVHFTPQAARWLAPWLLPQLMALAPAGATPGTVPAYTAPVEAAGPTTTYLRHRYPATAPPSGSTSRPGSTTTTTTGSTTTTSRSGPPTSELSPTTTEPRSTTTTEASTTTTTAPHHQVP